MPARFLRQPSLRHNDGFAKRVRDFVNRAMLLPGFPGLPVAGVVAWVMMVVVGGFGTGDLPLAMRIGFWGILLGWNILKWQTWFVWLVRKPANWPLASGLGAIVINLPLPLEIALSLELFGIGGSVDLARSWGQALVISLVIFAAIFTIRWHRGTAEPLAVAEPAVLRDGLLARAGVKMPGAVLAIRAEDHYCRLHLADGRNVLIHHRFGDALAEVAEFDGEQVHRGAWVAAHGVAGARREGRKWLIVLPDGTTVPVSAGHAKAARLRGWLRQPR
ncbi:hypothetical protein ACVWZA_000776 [Sphingomonas sp. UYAg733]